MRTPEVQPNGENATLEELRVAMEAAPNKRSYIRLNAIRALLLGLPRATLCQQFCRTDRMLRLWIEMFNRGGIDALITKTRPGWKRKVKLARVRDLLVPVLENPATVGHGYDGRQPAHGYLKEQLQLEFGYSTTVRWLHELNSSICACRNPGPNARTRRPAASFTRTCKPCALIPKSSCGSGMNPASKVDCAPAEDGQPPTPHRALPGGSYPQNVIGAAARRAANSSTSHCGRRGHRRFPMLSGRVCQGAP
ncbi:MAG: hypothetical protein U1F83_02060 [Verrucomicrobiota bacterium]